MRLITETALARSRLSWRLPPLAQTVYVSNERGNSVTVIDGAAGKVLATWPVGERPRGITLTRDGRFVLVCVSNDNAVKVIDRQTGKILREIGAGQDPEQFFRPSTARPCSSPTRTMPPSAPSIWKPGAWPSRSRSARNRKAWRRARTANGWW
jgi:YVTN family beta-propeller protein